MVNKRLVWEIIFILGYGGIDYIFVSLGDILGGYDIFVVFFWVFLFSFYFFWNGGYLWDERFEGVVSVTC